LDLGELWFSYSPDALSIEDWRGAGKSAEVSAFLPPLDYQRISF
jgi:hypothetical protein